MLRTVHIDAFLSQLSSYEDAYSLSEKCFQVEPEQRVVSRRRSMPIRINNVR